MGDWTRNGIASRHRIHDRVPSIEREWQIIALSNDSRPDVTTNLLPMLQKLVHYVSFAISLLTLSVTAYGDERKINDQLPNYSQQVLPVLVARCGACHGPEKQEAEVRFDQLAIDFVGDRAAAQTWHEARNAINAGKMPPEEEPQLTDVEREIVTRWISGMIDQAVAAQRSTNGRVVLRRLNNDEYQNTMFDLLGYDMDYTRDLPPDGLSPDGFRNNGRSLRMSAIQLEYYLDAARRALDKVIVVGPPPRVFRHRFDSSNINGWRGPTEMSNRLERSQKFLAKMVDEYPEEGEFLVRVRTRAQLRPDKGFPLLEVAVGYRPDTEVHFRVAGVKEVISESPQQFEFRGRLEKFPLPVRGQGKYPGLVVRLRNVYDDGTEPPTKLEKITREGKEFDAFREEPQLPHLLIESVEFEGPVFSEWPPKLHKQILFDSELRTSDEAAYVKKVLTKFILRAFRRPATEGDVDRMFAFFDSIRPDFAELEEAIRETLAMVLIQPDFLYLMETGGDEKRTINDWELASRLSFFVWSSMPDRRLFDLASHGLLHETSVLQAEVRRMLSDERSDQFTSQFTTEWLRLDGVETVSVDAEYYPEFTDTLKPDIQRETTEYFAELLRTDESALKLLESDFTMLNESLARHYGIEGVFGQRYRRVIVNAENRPGGLLGHASVLMANSTGQDSHPIRRAVWVRDRLLGDPPAPPPPDVPELDEANPDFARLSIREQLELHREKESCASCHRNLDPWGIALENFDAVGRWRDSIRKKHGGDFEIRPVNANDSLPDGTMLNGVFGLRDHLVHHRNHQFARALVRKLMIYALGRSLELTDEAELEGITNEFIAEGYRLRSLVEKIVMSESFSTK